MAKSVIILHLWHFHFDHFVYFCVFAFVWKWSNWRNAHFGYSAVLNVIRPYSKCRGEWEYSVVVLPSFKAWGVWYVWFHLNDGEIHRRGVIMLYSRSPLSETGCEFWQCGYLFHVGEIHRVEVMLYSRSPLCLFCFVFYKFWLGF